MGAAALRGGGARSARLRLARDRYRLGLQGFLTVLEAQRRAYDARSGLLQARRARLDARIDLVLALGGGWGTESQ